MAHPYHHALSSVKKWGGTVDDYLAVHDWFDASKAITADFRHRALRHHAEGIFLAETIFGPTLTLSTGRVIPTRWVGEQHVREDLGFIPSFADWVKTIRSEPWMGRARRIEVDVEPPLPDPIAAWSIEIDDTEGRPAVRRDALRHVRSDRARESESRAGTGSVPAVERERRRD